MMVNNKLVGAEILHQPITRVTVGEKTMLNGQHWLLMINDGDYFAGGWPIMSPSVVLDDRIVKPSSFMIKNYP